MTLDQLRIFAVVAQHQHITKAAKTLNMTQSAVSAAVTALEQRHGVTLFDRVGRSIVLNQTGRIFLERATRVLSEAKAAEAALDDLAGLQRGELSIMASQTIGAYWLPLRLARFHGRYPGISLDVRIGNTQATADAVEAGLVEVGVVEGQVDRPALSSRVVAIDEMIIVAAPGNPLADLRFVDRAHLARVPWVLREPGSGTRRAFESMAEKENLAISALGIAMVLPGNEAVLGAVEAGVGVTLTSRSAAATALSAAVLREVAYPPVPRPFFLLRHKERYRSKATAAFEALLAEDED
ncbi:LysR family transcriptional regulator [Rhizobiaceae bacterium n13]|uniref:LysR family transcriptional regulator n=1 Tax=Ferirhizobium litorale TaxID=2927786 RepID=A0AAE3QDM4_9HYPH|nr:LysR family transcriptional regulator [Fererhizobium litorale]MDI7861157.1 LysR family transcriptional regulator [Fererhizobium litorale]MDI7921304.1 LysR family transcriptional regulator [Fererhizobium litorale]